MPPVRSPVQSRVSFLSISLIHNTRSHFRTRREDVSQLPGVAITSGFQKHREETSIICTLNEGAPAV